MRRLLAYVIIDVTCWTTVMNAMWRLLRDKRNQQVLAGSEGLAIAATGLCAAFVYFFTPGKSPEAQEPTPPSVQANCGGMPLPAMRLLRRSQEVL
jgi:hypothetical protein